MSRTAAGTQRSTGRSPHGERGLKSSGRVAFLPCFAGRSPHGERGLKFDQLGQHGGGLGRSPHGERGLKFATASISTAVGGSLSSWRAWIEIGRQPVVPHGKKSLSSWRAWIEIAYWTRRNTTPPRRSPHGERGLKFHCHHSASLLSGRSPHGERGLKSKCHVTVNRRIGRSPHGERGLKFRDCQTAAERDIVSLSSWRAWIEM